MVIKRMKGQAFSTFQLMIAAIVAIAILGVLMSILGVIPEPGANPIQVTEDLLKNARAYPGSTFVSPSNPSFQSGMVIDKHSFAAVFGGFAPTLTFYCGTDLGSPLCVGGTELKIGGAFSARVSAWCDPNQIAARACSIGVGEVDSNTLRGIS